MHRFVILNFSETFWYKYEVRIILKSILLWCDQREYYRYQNQIPQFK